MLRRLFFGLLALLAVAAVYWFGAQRGLFGTEPGPGQVQGKVIPAEVIKDRMAGRQLAGAALGRS